ncbi:MAG: tetratricopeptide repeat protein [Myxococcaceae bacterium]|jgi:tetratricopeptide (TPR) repeat protein|nr:tetratricopeptide repeat protein [Myxococcaceae bacterium]MCA3011014.1 tetratricopeptide repeat protein [Myxococcaceae bacterium]
MPRSDVYRRGEAALRAGASEEAWRLFSADEEAQGTAADSAGKREAAEARLQDGDVAGAVALFEVVLERNPATAEAYAGLARLALATGQLDAAKVHALACVRLAPALGLGWTVVGLVHEALGESARALEALSKGAALGPNTFLCQLNHGRSLVGQGRPHEAVAPLKVAVALMPSSPDARRLLGEAYRGAKQLPLALEAFEQARALAPRQVEAWAALGDVLFEQGAFLKAREVLDRGLSVCGDHPVLLEKVLAATMMLDDVPGAMAYLEREVRAAPDHAQARLNLAHLALLQRDGARAERVLEELLERAPANAEAWFALGNLYGAVPLMERAEAAYRKAIDLDPRQWKPLLNLATLFIEGDDAKRHGEAVRLLERAQRLAPKDEWRVPYNLALAKARLGKRERAWALAQELVRVVPAGHALRGDVERLAKNLGG